MCPSTDDLQDWECCGKTPRRVPAKQYEMRMYTVFPLLCYVFEDTFCIVWIVLGKKKKTLACVGLRMVFLLAGE